MLTINTSTGKKILVDDEDYKDLNKHAWCINTYGYAIRSYWCKDDKRVKTEYMHRRLNKTKPGVITDHINGNKLDNRKTNLRSVTRAQNSANSRKGAKTKGVRRRGSIFTAQIGLNNKSVYLGNFKTQTDAARAYNAAATKYFGEFASLNNV